MVSLTCLVLRDPPPNLLIHQIVRLLLIEFCDVRLRIAGPPDRVRQGHRTPIRIAPARDATHPGPDSRSVIDHAFFGHGVSLDIVFYVENSLQYVTRSTGLQQVWVRRSVVYEVVSQPAATSERSWPRSIRTVSCERRNPRCF